MRGARETVRDLLGDLVALALIVAGSLGARGSRASSWDGGDGLVGGGTRHALAGGPVAAHRLAGVVLAPHRGSVGIVAVLGGLDLGRIQGGSDLGHHGTSADGGLQQVGDPLLQAGLDVTLLFGQLG